MNEDMNFPALKIVHLVGESTNAGVLSSNCNRWRGRI